MKIHMSKPKRGAPTERHFEPLGRFPLDPFTMYYDGTHYQYKHGTGKLDHEEVVYAIICANPGIGTRKLRKKAVKDSRDTDAAVKKLERLGRIENRSDGTANHYFSTLPPEDPKNSEAHSSTPNLEDKQGTVLGARSFEARGKHTSSTPLKHGESTRCASKPPDHRSGVKHTRLNPQFRTPKQAVETDSILKPDPALDMDARKASKIAAVINEDDESSEIDFDDPLHSWMKDDPDDDDDLPPRTLVQK
jgi:hypothetical protein